MSWENLYRRMRNVAAGYSNIGEENGTSRRLDKEFEQVEAEARAIQIVPDKQDLILTIHELRQQVQRQHQELMTLREFAGGQCVIHKVIADLGPISLWSKTALEEYVERRIKEAQQ